MPGVYNLSLDYLDEEIAEVVELGIPAIVLFGVPAEKDDCGSQASLQRESCSERFAKLRRNFRPCW